MKMKNDQLMQQIEKDFPEWKFQNNKKRGFRLPVKKEKLKLNSMD
jgi:hypothetical protein